MLKMIISDDEKMICLLISQLLDWVLEIKEAIQEKRAHDVYENKLILEVKETRDKMKKRFLTSILSQQNMQVYFSS